MDRRETLAEAIASTKELLTRYLAGFTDASATRQAPALPNHVLWSLGHTAFSLHRIAERLDGIPPSPADFTPGHPPESGERPTTFYIESVAFDSAPRDEPGLYPTLARAREVYERACDRLASAIRAIPDAKLDEATPWHGGPIPFRRLVIRMCFHNGFHAGQIADLRRALNLERVIK